jgi:hypothetical protein
VAEWLVGSGIQKHLFTRCQYLGLAVTSYFLFLLQFEKKAKAFANDVGSISMALSFCFF